jgi:hypothetical protein
VTRSIGLAALSAWLAAALLPANSASAAGDYPTYTVVDYVLGCMKSNGQSRDVLERCSCSIDVIASIVPYQRYESAETFKRMSQMTGEASGLFRESALAKAAGSELRRAQAEADIRCF